MPQESCWFEGYKEAIHFILLENQQARTNIKNNGNDTASTDPVLGVSGSSDVSYAESVNWII